MSLLIEDIFYSIQGEGLDTGLPTTFIRLFGCDVGCKYCDQKQKLEDKSKMSLKKIVTKVRSYQCDRICITGGEPLMQWESLYALILELVHLNYKVSIETSGCYPIIEDHYNRSFKYVMDIKTPSSGVSTKNILDNMMFLQSKDEVKFVITNEEDYKFAKNIMRSYPTRASFLMSPVFSNKGISEIKSSLVDWIIKDNLYNVRVQVQLHKILEVK